MKKNFSILLWIISFCFSGFLCEPVSNFIREKKWFNEDGPINLWLNTPKYTNLQFVVFIFLLVVFVVLGYILFYHYLAHKSKIKKNSPEELLKEYNYYVDTDNNIKITWDVYFGVLYHNDPFPANIKIFCLKHDPPQLMKYDGCLIQGCPNGEIRTTEADIKRIIQSMLLAKYDELKKQSKSKKKK